MSRSGRSSSRRTERGIPGPFPGSPENHRDEFAFVKAVLDDAEARYPIDTRRLWASGFSQGASMVLVRRMLHGRSVRGVCSGRG